MTIKALYPTIRPSLDLNFARTKALDPRITFTRASTGTFVGSNGLIQSAAAGQARFEHNPTTGESLGLLVEEARTNLALYSEQFDNAYWQGAIFTRTPNAAVAPDGTITADKLTPDNGVTSNNFTISRFFSGLTGSTTGSFYVKSAGHRYARISAYVLDLLSTQNGQYSAYVGNGWHRIYHEFTTSSFDFGLNITALVPGQGYTGNGVDGIYIWGAQLEAGAFPSSYIPTVASTVTRASDVADITGANFRSWFNASSGSLISIAQTPIGLPWIYNGAQLVGGFTAGGFRTNGFSVNGFYASGILQTGVPAWLNNVNVNIMGGLNIHPGQPLISPRYGFMSWSATEGIYGINGFFSSGVSSSDASLISANVNKLVIGHGDSIHAFYNLPSTVYIKRLAFYPSRLSNSQLATLM